MRPAHLLALTACLPVLAAVQPTARSAPASVAPALDATDITFKERAKKVLASGKKADMESLVRSESPQAAAWIVRLDDLLVDRDDPVEKALRDALVEGWNASIKTAFPKLQDEYVRSLDEAKKKTRIDLRKRLVQALGDLETNREAKDGLMFVQTAEELDVLAGAFDSEGDLYYASEAYVGLATIFDEPLRGPAAEPHKAWQNWTKAAELRGKIECKDDRWDEAEKRRGELAKRGFDKAPDPAAPDKGGEGGKGGETPPGPAGPPPGEAGNPITVALTFEPLAGPEAFARPCYQADEIYPLWTPMRLGAKGTTGTFQALGAESPVLHRIGSSDLRFDVDGDGKGDGPADQKITLTGTMTPFRVQIGKGDAARPWAFFAVTGIEQDNFQGLQVNLNPNDKDIAIYTLSAASVVGTLAGTPIRIIDDTMDGVYGSEPQTYGYGGLSNGKFQPEFDSIVVGTSKRARPWSQYQEVGGKWWKFEGGSKGKQVNAAPANVETGTLKLDCKGVMPNYVVVHGVESLKDSYFDLVEGGAKGVAVPAGRYTLYYGDVRKGKKRQMQKTLILPGTGSQNYDVAVGGTTVVKLGAPYTFDFTLKKADDKATVVGNTVVVTGAGSERYERPWNLVAHPEASWRKKGTKKIVKTEKMAIIQSVQTLDEMGQEGWLAIWFPLDLALDVKGAGEVEVQIVDEKHKLFGKVESPWKE
jgi:hypothetical protein